MKKQGFLKGSAILAGMVIITKVIGLCYKIPLTHILGGTGMGYFSSAFSVFTPVYALATAGIPAAMSRLAGENHALGRYKNLRLQKRTALKLYALLSFAACLALMALSRPLSRYVAGIPEIGSALVCLAPTLLFCSIINVERGYCEGLGNMLPTALSEIAETVFKLIFGLGLALYVKNSFPERGLPAIAAGALMGSSLASFLAMVLLIVGMKIHGDGLTPEMLAADPVVDSPKFHRRRLLGISAPIALGTVITTLTGMVDMLTVPSALKLAYSEDPAAFDNITQMGVKAEELSAFLYGSYEGLAVLIFGLVPTLTAMFGKSILPLLSNFYARGDRQGFAKGLGQLLNISAVIAIPAGLGIFALARPALNLLFHNRTAEIEAAAKPLQILGLAVIFFAAALPCFTVLQSLGRAGRVNFIILAAGGVKLALNLLLIPQPNVNLCGAAYAELVSSVMIFIAVFKELKALGGSGIDITETYIKPLYAGVMCALTAKLCYDKLPSVKLFSGADDRLMTVAAVCAGCIIYFISLYLLCETPKNLLKYVFSKKSEKST